MSCNRPTSKNTEQNKIRLQFDEQKTRKILRIQLPKNDCEDQMVQSSNKNGKGPVKDFLPLRPRRKVLK